MRRSPASPGCRQIRPRCCSCAWWPTWTSAPWLGCSASNRARCGCWHTGGCAVWPASSPRSTSRSPSRRRRSCDEECNEMIWRGDLPRAMRRLPSERFGRDLLSLPDPVVDRLLDATLDPADAPGPYAGVAAVLRSASSAAASTDVRGEAVVVAEMANAITAAAAVDDAPF